MDIGTKVYYVDEPWNIGTTVGPMEDDGVECFVPVEFTDHDGVTMTMTSSVGYLCVVGDAAYIAAEDAAMHADAGESWDASDDEAIDAYMNGA